MPLSYWLKGAVLTQKDDEKFQREHLTVAAFEGSKTTNLGD